MGALTLKVFSNEAREWELIDAEGIDPTDSFGVDLRLSVRENQILLAEPNDPTNPWITNKGRLFFEGMFDEYEKAKPNWGAFLTKMSEFLYFRSFKFSKKTIFFVCNSF